jgi:hypothetical protein
LVILDNFSRAGGGRGRECRVQLQQHSLVSVGNEDAGRRTMQFTTRAKRARRPRKATATFETIVQLKRSGRTVEHGAAIMRVTGLFWKEVRKWVSL